MDLVRFLREAIIEWARDMIVNLSGRLAEEFVSKRVRRRAVKRRRKRKMSRRN